MSTERTKDRELWLLEQLRQVRHEGFYGTLEIKYENGRIQFVRKTETLKPPG